MFKRVKCLSPAALTVILGELLVDDPNRNYDTDRALVRL